MHLVKWKVLKADWYFYLKSACHVWSEGFLLVWVKAFHPHALRHWIFQKKGNFSILKDGPQWRLSPSGIFIRKFKVFHSFYLNNSIQFQFNSTSQKIVYTLMTQDKITLLVFKHFLAVNIRLNVNINLS